MHRLESNEYNSNVIQMIKERQEQYHLALHEGGLGNSILKLVSSKESQVVDCLVHYSDPIYKYEGRTVFEFLFDSTESFEEF